MHNFRVCGSNTFCDLIIESSFQIGERGKKQHSGRARIGKAPDVGVAGTTAPSPTASPRTRGLAALQVASLAAQDSDCRWRTPGQPLRERGEGGKGVARRNTPLSPHGHSSKERAWIWSDRNTRGPERGGSDDLELLTTPQVEMTAWLLVGSGMWRPTWQTWDCWR